MSNGEIIDSGPNIAEILAGGAQSGYVEGAGGYCDNYWVDHLPDGVLVTVDHYDETGLHPAGQTVSFVPTLGGLAQMVQLRQTAGRSEFS